MEIAITILLAIIVLELYFILVTQQHIKDRLDHIWHGLFTNPNTALFKLHVLAEVLPPTLLRIEEILKKR